MQTRELGPSTGRRPDRWAPWWLYVVALVVTNLVRTTWLQPGDLAAWLEVVLGVGAMAAVATLVTVVWRSVRR